MKPRRILVATDLSASSALALGEASARTGEGGHLLVCHVVASWRRVNELFPQFNEPKPEADEALAQRARQAVAAFAGRATGRAGEAYEVAIEEGDAAAGIVRRAEAWGADLVVIGSHGSTSLPRIRLGGVAIDVVRHAHCPVLVVRPAADGGGGVVAGTDFSDSAMPALHAAVDEVRRTGGRAVLVHAVEWPIVVDAQFAGWAEIDAEAMQEVERAAKERLEQALASSGVAGECRVVRGEAGRALVREAEAAHADLIVVGTHGRTALSRMVLGSVAEFVVRTAHCSVLVVRLHRK